MSLISILALRFNNISELGIIIVTLIPVWLLAKRGKFFISSTINLIPFLGFLAILQIVINGISTGDILAKDVVYRACVETMRFYSMLISALLIFQTTDFAEIGASIRSLKTSEDPIFWNKLIEIFAFVLSTGYQMVPLLNREIVLIAEVQRAKGVGVTEGNRIQQAQKLVRMGTPLFLRTMELVKNTALALINYSYSPLRVRTSYRVLRFSHKDWLALSVLITSVLLTLLL